jgi:hypothetical protein
VAIVGVSQIPHTEATLKKTREVQKEIDNLYPCIEKGIIEFR